MSPSNPPSVLPPDSSPSGSIFVQPKAIAWLVTSSSYDSATTRYRCAHFAANLHLQGVLSRIFCKPENLLDELHAFSHVVVVERMDPGIVSLAVRAKEAGKGFFVDLSDDIVSCDHESLERGAGLATLRAIAPLTDSFVCSCLTMKRRLQKYLLENECSDIRVAYVPDCIETNELYRISREFWEAATGHLAPSAAVHEDKLHTAESEDSSINLLWFGNWGAPYSNAGLGSLLPVVAELNSYHHRQEISLDIMSNDPVLGGLIARRAKFKVRYHEWSRSGLGDLLGKAHFTLITTGDDQFSAVESVRSILLSLQAKVPAIIDRDLLSAAELWPDRESMPTVEKLVAILQESRAAGYEVTRHKLLAPVEPQLPRFGIERLGSIWLALLASARPEARQFYRPLRVAQFFGLDEDLEVALWIRRYCAGNGIEFIAIASLSALNERKGLFRFLGNNAIKPSIIIDENALENDLCRLRGADIVLLNSSLQKGIGKYVRRWSQQVGGRIMSQAEFIYERFGAAEERPGIIEPESQS